MDQTADANIAKKWYQKIPNAFVILFVIVILMSVLTYVVPSGEFERVEMKNGRMGVVPGTFHLIEKTDEMKVGPWDMFMAIPKGITSTGIIMVIVFLAGGMFKILEETRVIINSLGILVRNIEKYNLSKSLAVVVLTFVFGFFGAAIGYESLIPFVPLGVMVALGLGWDLMTGVGIVVGGLSVGFATSPINPYTVGVAHSIAELPTFSGMGLRTAFCVLSLLVLSLHIIKYTKKIEADPKKSFSYGVSTKGFNIERNQLENFSLDTRGKIILALFISFIGVVIFGVVVYKWYLTQLCALFLLYSLVFGIVAGFNADKIVNAIIKGASELMGGALIIGLARSIQVIMTQGKIGDTIINSLSEPLKQFSPLVSSIFMTLIQGVINFFIPSGSGQAMATMPIMIPLSDIIGVNRQIAVLAFQIGDGLINIIIPTLGGLLAMLAIGRVPFDKWVRFIFSVVVKLYILGWVFLGIAHFINWS